MVEIFAAVIIASVLGVVAGGVAAFTHRLFIAKEIAKLQSTKLAVEKAVSDELRKLHHAL